MLLTLSTHHLQSRHAVEAVRYSIMFSVHSSGIISIFVCRLINKNSIEAVCFCLHEKFILSGRVNVSSLLFPLTRFGFMYYPISVVPLLLLKTVFSCTTHHDFRQHIFVKYEYSFMCTSNYGASYSYVQYVWMHTVYTSSLRSVYILMTFLPYFSFLRHGQLGVIDRHGVCCFLYFKKFIFWPSDAFSWNSVVTFCHCRPSDEYSRSTF